MSATSEIASVEELACYLELTTDEVVTGFDAGLAHYSVSLDAPAVGSAGDTDPSRWSMDSGAKTRVSV